MAAASAESESDSEAGAKAVAAGAKATAGAAAEAGPLAPDPPPRPSTEDRGSQTAPTVAAAATAAAATQTTASGSRHEIATVSASTQTDDGEVGGAPCHRGRFCPLVRPLSGKRLRVLVPPPAILPLFPHTHALWGNSCRRCRRGHQCPCCHRFCRRCWPRAPVLSAVVLQDVPPPSLPAEPAASPAPAAPRITVRVGSP